MVKSILITRLSAIGDIVFSSVLLRALKSKYPEARIYWMIQSEYYSLLEHNNYISEVVPVPLRDWSKLLRNGKLISLFSQIMALRDKLRDLEIDLAIDAQGLLKSGFLTWLSGSGERIGLGSREGSGLLMTRVIEKPVDDPLIGSEYRYLISKLGANDGSFPMEVAFSESDRTEVDRLIQEQNLINGYVVVCPFTTRPQKHWKDNYWVQLIKSINQFLDQKVVILGGPGDKDKANRLLENADAGSINLAGATSISLAAAYINRATALVGVDTGLAHMGTAFEIPTVVLFGSTRPYLRTDSDKTVVIYKKLPCSPCRRKPTCHGEYTCFTLISPEEVMNQLTAVLKKN